MANFTEDARALLQAVLLHAEHGASWPSGPVHGDVRLFGLPPDSVLLRGDAVRGLVQLQALLATSALEGGGVRPEGIENMVVSACFISQRKGVDAAVAEFEAALQRDPGEWHHVRPVRVFAESLPLTAGRCVVESDLAAALTALGLPPERVEPFAKEFVGSVVRTTVEAGDRASARLVADDEVMLALAIMNLASAEGVQHSHPSVLTDPQGEMAISSGFPNGTVHVDGARRDGFWPPVSFLSEAAAKPASQRTEWERRCLGAIRWFYIATEASWPSQVIVSAMATMECLLLESQSVNGKGGVLGKRARLLGLSTGGLTGKPLASWVRELYQHRSSAAHEGEDHRRELDARSLVHLAQIVALRAARHLDPGHAGDGACTTFAQFLACEIPEPAKP